MVKRLFRILCFSGFLSLVGLSPAPVLGADWSPAQTIEFVVPAGPGGALDQVGRLLQHFFEQNKYSKNQMVVINKGGGNGKIAFDVLRQKPGDAHYLTCKTSTWC